MGVGLADGCNHWQRLSKWSRAGFSGTARIGMMSIASSGFNQNIRPSCRLGTLPVDMEIVL